jgi:hypothetical protein
MSIPTEIVTTIDVSQEGKLALHKQLFEPHFAEIEKQHPDHWIETGDQMINVGRDTRGTVGFMDGNNLWNAISKFLCWHCRKPHLAFVPMLPSLIRTMIKQGKIEAKPLPHTCPHCSGDLTED